MAKLRGRGIGAGMAMGSAAVVRTRNGIALLPEAPASLLEARAKRRSVETPDVVLVAEDYHVALNLIASLSWGKVVGLVAERAEPDAPVAEVPAVVNLPGLTALVSENGLLIVDATRALVHTDPDLTAIAQYQAEHDHIAPRHRVFLDDEHLPAQTPDGRTLTIIAQVETEEDLHLALEQGADALYLPQNVPLLPVGTDEDTLSRNLLTLAEAVAGKPLFLADDYTFPLLPVLEAAVRGDLFLTVPLRDDLEGLGLNELRAEIESAEAACLENDVVFDLPRLAVGIPGVPDTDDPAALQTRMEAMTAAGANRLLLDLVDYPLDESLLPALDRIATAAASCLLPVLMTAYRHSFNPFGSGGLENTLQTSLRFLIGLGVAGVIVLPEQVYETKALIRKTTFSESREMLRDWLPTL